MAQWRTVEILLFAFHYPTVKAVGTVADGGDSSFGAWGIMDY
ncbi:MAG: hypothetical protein SPD44_10500 [Prevotella sp.]|nr:hypothetical protein [Prevotella sp.]MDY4753121.1 hypothetical protein [Prevotella sp.]MEE1152728.1 hypothetical protein [Prevotella sp.]